MKVIAVVVTYNRKVLLTECLNAILNQSYKVEEVVLIDNNSTDGTYEYLNENNILKDNVKYIKLDKNVGGAGGFYEGMKVANKENCDFVWIMDDDTIPMQDTLKELISSVEYLNNKNEKVSFLASSVYGVEGEYMNVPTVDTRATDNGYSDWYKYLENGLIEIKRATFVSLLINNKAILECGLPFADFFIWGDDTEYTERLTNKYGSAYMVGNSKVIHKRVIQKALIFEEENDINRINMNFYAFRNQLINTKALYGRKKSTKKIIYNFIFCFKLLFKSKCKYRFKKIRIVLKATNAYIFKRYNVKKFNNRFNLEG